MTQAEQLALWDAINAYAQACGGDTSDATATVERQHCVVAIERVVAGMLEQRIPEAIEIVRLMKESVDCVWHYAANPARKLIDDNARWRRENDALRLENARLRGEAKERGKAVGVNVDDLRDWVLRRDKVQMRQPALKQGLAYARALLEVLETGRT